MHRFAWPKFIPKQPVSGREREMYISQPLQRHLAQAFADGIAHQQRADEHGAAHRCPEQHAQVCARVEAQAAANKGPVGHGNLNDEGTKGAKKTLGTNPTFVRLFTL